MLYWLGKSLCPYDMKSQIVYQYSLTRIEFEISTGPRVGVGSHGRFRTI